MKNVLILLLIFAGLVINFSSCKKDVTDELQENTFKAVNNFDNTVVHEWNNVFL